MIDKEEAINLVYNLVTRNGTQLLDNPPLITNDKKRELTFGWLFWWVSKKYLETGDPVWGYLGNAPVLVDKYTGTLQYVDSVNQSIDEFVEKYRKTMNYD